MIYRRPHTGIAACVRICEDHCIFSVEPKEHIPSRQVPRGYPYISYLSRAAHFLLPCIVSLTINSDWNQWNDLTIVSYQT
jgi:hypothetical protein